MPILLVESLSMLTTIRTPVLNRPKSSIYFRFTGYRYAMDKEIFMFERHTYTEMTYSLPVRNGHNTLILKFAEVYMSIINIDVLPEIWTEGVQYQNWWDHCCGKYGCFRQNWSKICRTLRVYRDRG